MAIKPVVAPAVIPNRGVQSWYDARLRAIVDAAHDELLRLLTAAYGTTAAPDIGFASDAPSRITAIERAMAEWAKKWSARFDKMSTDLALKFTARSFRATQYSMEAAFKKAGFTVEFRPTRASMQAAQVVVAENVGLIKSIPQEYLTDVQAQVWQSVKAGADLSSLSQELRQTYGVATRRAALISRDQNNKAKAVIEDVRRQQLGIKQAIWQHSSAGKVPRPTHVAMNNKPYEIGKGMYDPAVKKYVWPGSEINCRCTSRAVLPGVTAG